MRPVAIVLAVVLDLVLGDPRWLPHPVRLFGRVISLYERVLVGITRRPLILLGGGIVLALALPVGVWWGACWLLDLAYSWNYWTGLVTESCLLATTVALKGLGQAALAVRDLLRTGDLPGARREVGMIVGRDVDQLDTSGVIRAAVESVAENTVDAVIAPLFYAFLGGAPLALAYRAVNTLDSMVGYRRAHYRYLGWASARLDDLLNFLPARLAASLFILTAFLWRADVRHTWHVLCRDGRKHASPNSGLPEAAMAGLLGVRLGGPCFYGGELHPRPYLGEERVPLEVEHITQAVKALYWVSFQGLLVGGILYILLEWV
ncbi:cobalamin biosynthesis protein CobD [Ammonifex degensii KC4]|uniref:Cobalamin biosynthesis protein CobD n=1 Tax=Ammonifex degensii (strain DSM 10501 / KC4) TaxID=429009 RepID=C9R8D5_AMMDK|nr:adenosylcobinamide-phosphate synthase CbiB [Ammonifex degensii]ACX52564.1 cobalamin biosynthesis protein CobD [Ammonifex degensii KC4]